jgi:hypothetical protein
MAAENVTPDPFQQIEDLYYPALRRAPSRRAAKGIGWEPLTNYHGVTPEGECPLSVGDK